MNRLIKYIFILLTTLGTSVYYSQTAEEVLKKVNLTYKDKSYSMDYAITGFNIDNPVYSYKGQVAKSGYKHLSKTDDEVTMINDQYFFHINHERKVIVLNEIEKNIQKSENGTDIIQSLDSLIKQSNPLLKSKLTSGFEIELKQKNDQYYETIVLMVNEKYQLVGVTYYAKNTDNGFTKIDVTYKNIVIKETIPSTYFSIKGYLQISKNQIRVIDKYASYRVIDQRKN